MTKILNHQNRMVVKYICKYFVYMFAVLVEGLAVYTHIVNVGFDEITILRLDHGVHEAREGRRSVT